MTYSDPGSGPGSGPGPGLGSGLRGDAIRGTLWSGLQQVGDRGIRFFVYLVLARLLPPEAFGLVTLAAVAIEFTQLFLNQGLTAAIVQRDKLEDEHLDAAFWGNLGFGLLLALCMILIAPSVSRLLNEPALTPILRTLSAAFVLTGLSAVQEAVLRRGMQFRALAGREIGGQAAGGVVGVAMAFSGFGVWSLVAMTLIGQAVGAVLLWRASTWRPSMRFSGAHYGDLFSFGVNILGINVLRFLRDRADNLLIGGVLGAASLGYYSLARQLVGGAMALISGTIMPVAWSTLSRLQKQPERFGRATYEATGMIALVLLPVFTGLLVAGPDIVVVLYGSRWLPSAPVVQAFALGTIAIGLTGLNLTAITAVGEIRWRVRIEVIMAVVTLVAVVLALPAGLAAVAWASAAAAWVIMPVQLAVAVRILPVRLVPYVRQLLLPVISALLVFAALVLVSAVAADAAPAARLALQVLAAGAVYGLLLFVACPPSVRAALRDLRQAVTSRAR